MVPTLFLNGFIIGFAMALPVGPVALLCIRYTVFRGMVGGFVAGLGAAFADSFYSILAIFGMTLICDFLSHFQIACHLFGAFILLGLAIQSFKAKPQTHLQDDYIPISYKNIFLATFLLTLTNPLTLLGFAGIYTAFGITINDHLLHSAWLTLGIFCGSISWWFAISCFFSIIRKKMNLIPMKLFNYVSGGLFLICSFFAAASAFFNFHF